MNISYNWLKEYLDFDLNHNLVAEILTDLGLEVEGISKYESVPGSLEGVVVGKITSLKEHPNADRLKITTVDIGEKDELQIKSGTGVIAAPESTVTQGVLDPLNLVPNLAFRLIGMCLTGNPNAHITLNVTRRLRIGVSHTL